MIFHPDTVYENILDIGCGLGDLSNMIYKKNIQNSGRTVGVTATDISKSAIKKHKSNILKFSLNNLNLTESSIYFVQIESEEKAIKIKW